MASRQAELRPTAEVPPPNGGGNGTRPGAPEAAGRQRRRLGPLGVAIVALMAIASALIAYVQWSQRAALPEGLIQANGRIEGDRITVASKVAGRLRELRVREGDTVRAGDVVAVLDEAQAEARVAQAAAAVEQARARSGQAEAALQQAQVAVTRTELAVTQAQLRAEQARQAVASRDARVRAAGSTLAVLRREVDVGIETAAAGLEQARAAVERATAAEAQAAREAARWQWLAEQELVEPQRAEQAQLAWTAARSEVVAARSGLRQAEQRVVDAALGPERVRAAESELDALERERANAAAALREAETGIEDARSAARQTAAALAQARGALRQAAGGEAQARATLAEVESARGDLTIVAPTGGIVMTRTADTGEVVGAGAPLLDLADLDRLYLRVFVAETDIGKLRLGLPAQVYTDAFPDQPFPATVQYIASRAEFTPKEIQTPDERVKLVYAAKLYLDANPEHRLTPGLPADAIIRWKPDTPWQRPRW